MAKQYAAFFVSWRDAPDPPFALFANEASFGKASAAALEARLNALAEDGWIVDRIVAGGGLSPQQSASFTIVAFK